MHVGERIKSLRGQLGMTQTDLAQKVGMTYIQIGRYETRKAKPSSEILQKIAAALNTTTDFLMNGSTDELAANRLMDQELLHLFKSVELLNAEDKKMVKTFLDAIITKRHVQKLAS